MQIKDISFAGISDWLSGGQQQSSESSFMDTLSTAMSADSGAADATELVTLLSGVSDNNTTSLSSADAMFSVLTQNMMQSLVQSALQAEKTPEQLAAEQLPTAFAQGSAPGVGDIVDMVNPLQHIPLVSQYYREWTGDDMGYVSQVAGGALWGGALGVATSFINIGLTSVMGKSPSDYIHQFLSSDEANTTAIAASKGTSAPVAVKAVTS